MKKQPSSYCPSCHCFSAPRHRKTSRKVAVGVRVGINGSSLLIPRSTFESAYSTNYNSEQAMKVGAVAGLDIDIKLKEKLSLQTGLFYSWQRFGQEQGAVFTDTNNVRYSIGSVNQYTVHHLRLPVMVKYHFSTNPNHFVIAAGLYADYALSGEITYDASAVLTQENNQSTKYFGNGTLNPYKAEKQSLYYHIGNDEYISQYDLFNGKMLKNFDLGAAIELGYQISKFYIGVQADFGLLNIARPEFFGDSFVQRNFNLQLAVGYRIN